MSTNQAEREAAEHTAVVVSRPTVYGWPDHPDANTDSDGDDIDWRTHSEIAAATYEDELG